MKIALVCPSNKLYMPYVDNYIKIFNEYGINYSILNWDRFNIEEESKLTYRDSKIGHKRNFIDYFKYTRFVLNILKENNYDKIIIFGVQLLFFLRKYLIKEYTDKFIIDIRDHNRIIKFYKIKKSIECSNFTVLSSPGYKEWLPTSNKYVINHNTQVVNLDDLKEVNFVRHKKSKFSIGCIGAIRDYQVNIDFIESLKNSNLIQLNYHGEGDINNDILKYLTKNNIVNVNFTGRYQKEDEPDLYYKNEIINVLRYNDGINNKTALPNRLYNAILYGKPLITFDGTLLAKIVSEYNLGIVLKSFDNLENNIIDYIYNFNQDSYNKGRKLFFDKVIKDNKEFRDKLEEFIK